MTMTSSIDPAILTGPAEAWAGLIVPVAIKVSLLLGLFGILNLTLRRASASTRHLIWTLGLVSILLLPILDAGLPSWQVLDLSWLPSSRNGTQETITPATQTFPPVHTTQAPNLAFLPGGSSVPTVDDSRQITADATSGSRWLPLPSLPVKTWVFIIWQAGILLLLGTILWAALQLWNLKRKAKVLSEDGWGELLESKCKQLEIPRLPRLMRSHKELTPMTWGVRRANILLPANCERWTTEQRHQVLLHELAHVKRRDCSTQIAAQLACLVYWFNPLVWMAARQTRVERERACDDQVLASGAKASVYASNLLNIACSLGSENRTLAFSLGMARRSQISGRLLAVLDPKRRRVAPGRYLSMIAAVLTLAVVLPLAVVGSNAQARESRSGRKATVSIKSDRGPNPYKIRWDGEIKLSGDGRAIEWMSEDAYLQLEQKIDGKWRKLMIEPDDDGKPVYVYKVGRKQEEFNDEAAEWLADMLEEISPDGEFFALELPELPSLPSLPSMPSLPSLPSVPSLPSLPSLPSGGSVNIRDNDSGTRISWERKEDGAAMKIEMEGRIEFNEDETGIAWMDEDAYFKLEEKKGRKRITIEAEPAEDGRPVYNYKVGRKTKPFDDEAAAWLADVLKRTMLELGINADARVQRAYEKDGSRGVLELIDRIDSDYSLGIHCRAYLALDGLRDDEVDQVLGRIARDLDSDYELASVLTLYVDTYLASEGTWKAFVVCMSSIDSDYEKARVLKEALDRDVLTHEGLVLVLETANDIDSDYEVARVLIAVDPDMLSDEAASRAYFEALRDIGSDYEKAGVLLSLARHARRDENLREACLNAADTIDSDYEHSRVMKALR